MTTIAHDRPIDLAVSISVPGAVIEADWSVPLHPRGTIIIANGTGNGRLGRRNRQLAHLLYDASFATLLLDLLTPEEETENDLTGVFQLDVGLFSERLLAAMHWVNDNPEVGHSPLGILASGVASAAALSAAAREGNLVKTIVSRGGRPDLAGIDLHRVIAPSLLIVGSTDTRLYELNRWALYRLNGEKRLAVIPGASHLFEEIGAFDAMCRVAMAWFNTHMSSAMPAGGGRSILGIPWTPDRNAAELVP
jgi:putative phosphoribosyl transferase